MKPHGSRDTPVADARIVAASPEHALVRVRVRGRSARPGEVSLRFVTADGDPGAGRPLPAAGTADGDGWLLAFALPLPAVRSRPQQLALVNGARSWPVPWSPPDPLVPGSEPAALHERVHTGMAFRGVFKGTWHLAVGGVAWFVYLTEMMFQSTVGLPDAWEQLLGAVAVSVLVIGSLAVGWVAWNLWLFRRHGERRRRTPDIEPSLDRDALGRRIVSSVPTPAEARTVVVTIAGDGAGAVKRFAEQLARA